MGNQNLKEQLALILENSGFLKTAEKTGINKDKNAVIPEVRKLTKSEITALIKRNNYSPDWEIISVDKNFSPEFIRNSRFYGKCILGKFTGKQIDAGNSILLETGIYNSILRSSEAGSESLIESCGIISNYTVSGGTVLFHVKNISASEKFHPGINGDIIIGPETGERSIKVFNEITLNILKEITAPAYDIETYERFIKAYSEDSQLTRGFIGEKCVIKNTISISDTIIEDDIFISGAGMIDGSAILRGDGNQTSIGLGVEIRNSSIQQGCEISSMAVIHNSIIMGNSVCEKKCLISSSIVGPGSSIGEAEITSSLTGPLTAAHHHSLLISAIWPDGKGNLGYGANVGSNHTSRQPDQEIFPGEGMFFGLGSSIKFPADYRNSPYSIISTGVITMPQKVEFPFSLINQPSQTYKDISPHINEIFPAWGLYRNIYSVIRNESKYIKRNRSGLNRSDLEIFRPRIIEMMIAASNRLDRINIKQEIYTSASIEGLGKNFMTEESRTKALEAYNFHITYYALKHLAQRAAKVLGDDGNKDSIYLEDNENPWWHHSASLLEKLGLKAVPLKESLEKYISLINILNEEILNSRAVDYHRGEKIIDDYSHYHGKPAQDPVILEFREKSEIEKSRLLQIIKII